MFKKSKALILSSLLLGSFLISTLTGCDESETQVVTKKYKIDTPIITPIDGGIFKMDTAKVRGNVGEIIDFEVEPFKGYELDFIKFNDQNLAKETRKLTPIEGNNKIEIGYKKLEEIPSIPEEVTKKGTVKIKTDNNGTVSIDKHVDSKKYDVGTILTLNINPNEGYHLDTIKHNNSPILKTNEVYKFKVLEGENIIEATFKKDETIPEIEANYYDLFFRIPYEIKTLLDDSNNNLNIYLTNEDNTLNNSWPGEKMSKVEETSDFTFKIDKNKFSKVKFNVINNQNEIILEYPSVGLENTIDIDYLKASNDKKLLYVNEKWLTYPNDEQAILPKPVENKKDVYVDWGKITSNTKEVNYYTYRETNNKKIENSLWPGLTMGEKLDTYKNLYKVNFDLNKYDFIKFNAKLNDESKVDSTLKIELYNFDSLKPVYQIQNLINDGSSNNGRYEGKWVTLNEAIKAEEPEKPVIAKDITFKEITNGKVEASKSKGNVGDKVTLTIIPNENYICESLTHNGKLVKVTNNKATITLEKELNEIGATFKPIKLPEPIVNKDAYVAVNEIFHSYDAKLFVTLYENDTKLTKETIGFEATEFGYDEVNNLKYYKITFPSNANYMVLSRGGYDEENNQIIWDNTKTEKFNLIPSNIMAYKITPKVKGLVTKEFINSVPFDPNQELPSFPMIGSINVKLNFSNKWVEEAKVNGQTLSIHKFNVYGEKDTVWPGSKINLDNSNSYSFTINYKKNTCIVINITKPNGNSFTNILKTEDILLGEFKGNIDLTINLQDDGTYYFGDKKPEPVPNRILYLELNEWWYQGDFNETNVYLYDSNKENGYLETKYIDCGWADNSNKKIVSIEISSNVQYIKIEQHVKFTENYGKKSGIYDVNILFNSGNNMLCVDDNMNSTENGGVKLWPSKYSA